MSQLKEFDDSPRKKIISQKRAVQHLQSIENRDEYGTPFEMLRNAIDDYQIFPKLDVCTNFYNKKFDYYFTKEDNALTKEWDVDFFMNPPYSQIKKFMKYAYTQHLKHNVNGLILIFGKTDTKWWDEFVENKAEIHPIKGRIKFLDESGQVTKHPAPYPSVWIIYRKNKVFRSKEASDLIL